MADHESCVACNSKKKLRMHSFWVGRDHAGYKNFFSKYQSQNFCKFFKKKIGIKIIAEREPYYCKKHQQVGNNFKKSSSKNKIFISGTKIRKYILKKKIIPKYMMSSSISNLLGYHSILK